LDLANQLASPTLPVVDDVDDIVDPAGTLPLREG